MGPRWVVEETEVWNDQKRTPTISSEPRANTPPMQIAGSSVQSEQMCEQCGSAALRALSLIHEMGTSSVALMSDSLGLGVDAGGMGLGAAVTQTRGRTQTALAARTAPPTRQVARWRAPQLIVVVSGVCALVAAGQVPGFGLFLFLCGVGFAGWVALREHRRVGEYNRTEYRRRLETWRGSALCLVCGHVQVLRRTNA